MLFPLPLLSITTAQYSQAAASMLHSNLCERKRSFNILGYAVRLFPNQCSRPKTRPSTRTSLRRGRLKLRRVSIFSTPRTQYLASTSLLPLHALYQNTFALGAWQLLDSDGSLPAHSQSRPKPRLSSGLLLASDAPEPYPQGSQAKPGHCRLWNTLQPELQPFHAPPEARDVCGCTYHQPLV